MLKSFYILKKFIDFSIEKKSYISLVSFDYTLLHNSFDILTDTLLNFNYFLCFIFYFLFYLTFQLFSFYSSFLNINLSNLIIWFLFNIYFLNLYYFKYDIFFFYTFNLYLIQMSLLYLNSFIFLELLISVFLSTDTYTLAKLPNTLSKYTILKSPHVDKKSREQFESRKFRYIYKISSLYHLFNFDYVSMHLPSGINFISRRDTLYF
jgi:hypothetical protein